jgi:two-component system, NtrC family, sensor histidine kinase KinB
MRLPFDMKITTTGQTTSMTPRTILLSLLVITTAIALVAALPAVQTAYWAAVLAAGIATAAAIYLGVLLSEGEISLAYVVGILSIILLPTAAGGALTWGICLGGVSGSALRAIWRQRRPRYHRTAHPSRNIITVSARVTLSFVVATTVYQAAGGRQPLSGFTAADGVPLAALFVSYIAVFFAIFLAAVWINHRSTWVALRENWLLLALVLALPFPVILISTELSTLRSPIMQLLLAAVLLPIAVGLFVFSRMRYRLRRQAQELQALANISQAMGANEDVAGLLTAVYRELADLLHIDYFTALLCADKGWHLVVEVRPDQPLSTGRLIPPQPNTPLARVLDTQMPLLLPTREAAFRQGLVLTEPAVLAWLGVPLRATGQTLGALAIATMDRQQPLGAYEQQFLNLVATATSAAISNIQLYKQQAVRVAQLGNLNAVLALLTETLSPDAVLDTVISSASAVSDATAVAVYRSAAASLTLVRSAGLPDDFVPEPLLKRHELAEPVSADQPVLIADVNTDARVAHLRSAALRAGQAAWVELPLLVSGEAVGAIILYFDGPQRLLSEQIELLRTFANQAAQAIVNADLYAGTYRALEERIDQLSALAALGRDLMMTLDQRRIGQVLLQSAFAATDSQRGAIVFEEAGALALLHAEGYPAGTFTNTALLAQGITGHVWRTGQVVRQALVESHPDYLPLMPTTRAQLSVPLLWQGRSRGVLTLESSTPEHFTSEHEHFLMQLTNQAAFAFEHALLFRAVAEGRDRMQAILNTVTEGLILIDRRGQIALANPRVDMLHLDYRQLAGANLSDLLEDPTLNLAQRLGFQSGQDMLQLARTGAWSDGVFGYTLDSEPAPIFIQREIIPAQDPGGDVIGLLLVFRDETEQYNLERAREEFSQMIIHDLRSPLTAVTSSVELLAEMVPPESDISTLVQKTAGSSQRAIRKLLNRVDSLLDISRMKSGKMSLQLEIAELAPLVTNVQNELAPLAHEMEIDIWAHLPTSPVPLVIDTEKIERVLLNLVDNALKFSPRQSQILVKAQTNTDSGSGSTLYVEVIDNGPGVPENERESIFDRFVQIQQQGGRQRRGSGLGLSFCKMVVEAHGGRIWIASNPAGGSIFTFTLPLTHIPYELE